MRLIATWCLGVAAIVLNDLAAAERLKDNSPRYFPSLDQLRTINLGDPLRLVGSSQGETSNAKSDVENTWQYKPLRAAEIAKRLGMNHSVLVSTWDAGFPNTLTWDPENVVDDGAGGVALRLSMPQISGARPFRGGEFQIKEYSTVWGRVEWQVRLPVGIPGSVAAMFLYKNPYSAKTDRELDLEYVPGDPKVAHEYGTMQMTLHMKRHDGSGGKEKQSYRINLPARCVEAICGWAIEFQPDSVIFQISLNRGGGWETIGRFTHSAGWDLTAGTKYDGAIKGMSRDFSSDEIWSEHPVTSFVSYWFTNDQTSWLGALDETDLIGELPQFDIKSMTPVAYDTLSPFRPRDWSVAANGKISIARIPNDGLRLTEIQYRIDIGEWHSLDGSTLGSYAVSQRPVAGQSIEIRGVARGPAYAESGYEIVSDRSDTKIIPES